MNFAFDWLSSFLSSSMWLVDPAITSSLNRGLSGGSGSCALVTDSGKGASSLLSLSTSEGKTEFPLTWCAASELGMVVLSVALIVAANSFSWWSSLMVRPSGSSTKSKSALFMCVSSGRLISRFGSEKRESENKSESPSAWKSSSIPWFPPLAGGTCSSSSMLLGPVPDALWGSPNWFVKSDSSFKIASKSLSSTPLNDTNEGLIDEGWCLDDRGPCPGPLGPPPLCWRDWR